MKRDGPIPVLFKAHDSNRKDNALHEKNWQKLRRILGRPDFIYVADFKLCVSKTLTNTDLNQGRFIAIMPRIRRGEEEPWIKIAQEPLTGKRSR